VEGAKRSLESLGGAMRRAWAIAKGNLAALALVVALGSAPAAPAAAQEEGRPAADAPSRKVIRTTADRRWARKPRPAGYAEWGRTPVRGALSWKAMKPEPNRESDTSRLNLQYKSSHFHWRVVSPAPPTTRRDPPAQQGSALRQRKSRGPILSTRARLRSSTKIRDRQDSAMRSRRSYGGAAHAIFE
jgi:hypothetical protein